MAPPIPSSKLTLSYPIYACDFDPSDSCKLVVGGGGGAGRNGVGNKITVLDTSQQDVLEEVCEIGLSKDEDNVTSLVVGKTVGKTTLVYAGINSSSKDLESGKNEHYRTFGLETSAKGKKKAAETKISELGRSKLFQEKDKDAYQRILRFSRPYPEGPQLGAVTTGLAKTPEIVIFDNSSSPPRIRGRIVPINEAEDVDIIQTGDEKFEFAYCDKRNIYLKTISKETEASDPVLTYATPGDASDGSPLPSFRSLRFLTPGFLLMLTNVASNAGVVLQVLRLDPDRKIHARIPLSKRLPSSISKATGLAVVNLSPPLSPGEKQDTAQYAMAVAGHDCSISIFTLEYQVVGNVDQFANLNCVRVLKSVHPNILTSLAFSNFIPPPHPVTEETKPQYIKLASVSMVNTVIVHTLPLSPLPISTKTEQNTKTRYVLTLPSNKPLISLNTLIALLVLALGLLATQGILEYQGVRTSSLGLTKPELSQKWTNIKAGYAPYGPVIPVENTPITHNTDNPAVLNANQPNLQRLLSRLGTEPGVVYIREEQDLANQGTDPSVPASIKADLHDEAVQGPHGGRTWDVLSDEEKEMWRRRLVETGHWAEDMPETLLKGIVFAQLGGLVREGVGAALGG